MDGNEAGLTGEFQAASDGQARVEVALELPAADAALQVAATVPHTDAPKKKITFACAIARENELVRKCHCVCGCG